MMPDLLKRESSKHDFRQSSPEAKSKRMILDKTTKNQSMLNFEVPRTLMPSRKNSNDLEEPLTIKHKSRILPEDHLKHNRISVVDP